jgi:ABC-type dipeptide/oligopeptide/nickel transport system ATPase component
MTQSKKIYAMVGGAGSGKSVAATLLAERHLQSGRNVVVFDQSFHSSYIERDHAVCRWVALLSHFDGAILALDSTRHYTKQKLARVTIVHTPTVPGMRRDMELWMGFRSLLHRIRRHTLVIFDDLFHNFGLDLNWVHDPDYGHVLNQLAKAFTYLSRRQIFVLVVDQDPRLVQTFSQFVDFERMYSGPVPYWRDERGATRLLLPERMGLWNSLAAANDVEEKFYGITQ